MLGELEQVLLLAILQVGGLRVGHREGQCSDQRSRGKSQSTHHPAPPFG